ncbi:hypothetical protein BD410DRAFT_108185 [Rickenella mellea]|uniref:Uncharacterized protein n=1 Tax=Rickenella mellea TaxID=50990 RepID=A0A4Y7PLZ6_9AGAM|nr:hypothetical protein BD410DRAFT_108185 [Rickenella mellea]
MTFTASYPPPRIAQRRQTHYRRPPSFPPTLLSPRSSFLTRSGPGGKTCNIHQKDVPAFSGMSTIRFTHPNPHHPAMNNPNANVSNHSLYAKIPSSGFAPYIKRHRTLFWMKVCYRWSLNDPNSTEGIPSRIRRITMKLNRPTLRPNYHYMRHLAILESN